MPDQAAQAARLKVLLGTSGANKVWHLYASASPSEACPEAKTQQQGLQARGVVLFFVGDQLEGGVSQEVLAAQDPHAQAAAMASKWPGRDVLVVMPSRLEAGAACYDHFLNRTTRTGEPLGYQGHTLKASMQVWSLLGAAGLLGDNWRSQAAVTGEGSNPLQEHNEIFPEVIIVGFSKGGVILNQLLAEAAHCCSLLHKEGPSGAAREASPDVEGFDWARPTVSIGGASSPSSSPLSSPSSFTSPSHSHSSVTAARAAAADEGASSSPEPRALCGGRPSVEFPPRIVDPGHLMLRFLSSVREIHYCDAGLHCRGAFMTDPRVTEELKLLADRLRVTVHGSPRQLRDPTRPWVTKEAETSVDLLSKAGLQARIIRYFEGEELSLEMHFSTIAVMRAGEDEDDR